MPETTRRDAGARLRGGRWWVTIAATVFLGLLAVASLPRSVGEPVGTRGPEQSPLVAAPTVVARPVQPGQLSQEAPAIAHLQPGPIGPFVSFSTETRAVHLPVQMVAAASPAIGQAPTLSRDEALLVTLPSAAIEPVSVAGLAEPLVVIYVGADRRVARIARPSEAAATITMPPYTFAVIAPADRPLLGRIELGDRFTPPAPTAP